jgi:hypothetical protein
MTNVLASQRWQPIETAPRDGTRILAIWRNRPSAAGAEGHEVVRWCGWGWGSLDTSPRPEPTDWMLPPPASSEQP